MCVLSEFLQTMLCVCVCFFLFCRGGGALFLIWKCSYPLIVLNHSILLLFSLAVLFVVCFFFRLSPKLTHLSVFSPKK